MKDTIEIKMECGGYEITGSANSSSTMQTKVSGDRKAFHGDEISQWKGGSLGVKIPFFVEAEDPSKLHRFLGMEYQGLVNNPRYKTTGTMLREMIEKFDGCLIIYEKKIAYLITTDKAIEIGCDQGVDELLKPTYTGFEHQKVTESLSLNRIDASKIPAVMVFASCHEDEIRSMYNRLGDVTP